MHWFNERLGLPFARALGRAVTFGEVFKDLPLRFSRSDVAEKLHGLHVPPVVEVKVEAVQSNLQASTVDIFIRSALELGLIRTDFLRRDCYWNVCCGLI